MFEIGISTPRALALLCVLAFVDLRPAMATESRHETSLDVGWRTVAGEANAKEYQGFELPGYDDSAWTLVDVPHNWDDYWGDHRLVHGNRHGCAWYRREFAVPETERGRRVFLFFEGVGSYATIWVNGKLAGKHAGGRTTFTLDVTDLIKFDGKNLLAVRADHPSGITDLPWVCGGCSTQNGFSEGSQPMGIFRPVHLVTTGVVRVEPFGVHVWNDESATRAAAVVHMETELRNYDTVPRTVTLETCMRDPKDSVVATLSKDRTLAPGETAILRQDTASLRDVELWCLKNPFLYTLETTVREGGQALDRTETQFGIRVVQWPSPTGPPGGQFRLNGQPVFINGTCEYEHLLGNSHAFGKEQIRARVKQIEAAGFNAFRDAHQPHNLRYQDYWDRDGVLWWPQFSAHIWFDNEAFRSNFKTLLREWVKERRNSPSLVLWGLQNECVMPEAFARECRDIIREMDPTTPSQRLVTTCNGGKGTDWNVPQNWTGTYGGDPTKYANDIVKQRLVGEYGAWRSLGLHEEDGLKSPGVYSEERFAALMEMKVRLAESVRDHTCGQFHWLFATHENPGRKIGSDPMQVQGADGWGELDGIGPANNKGLLTLWGEPTDAYYMFRANYAPAKTDPMVVIAGHTWPDRRKKLGRKSNIIVYSNCDEVELFNDYRHESLGVRKRGPIGTHFEWDNVDVQYNVIYAEGRVGGKVVATDSIVLKNLPAAPHRSELNGTDLQLTTPANGWNYLYRVNCGGGEFTDTYGQNWRADRDYAPGDVWGSLSWAAEFGNVSARFGSQREIFDAIAGTRDEELFQTFRYGREKLRYIFAVPPGDYRVELFFIEPWYGRGGGNCAGWRLFDVAVNGETKLRDLDLWREAGYARAVKKVVSAKTRDGWLEISFPRVASYEAVISAIAISTKDAQARVPKVAPPAPASARDIARVAATAPGARPEMAPDATQGESFPATEAKQSNGVTLDGPQALLTTQGASLTWEISVGLGGAHEMPVRYINAGMAPLPVELKVVAPDGTVVDSRTWELPPSKGPGMSGPPGDLDFNAGDYKATLTLERAGVLKVEALLVK
jgi:hypothetical protein